MCLRVRMRDGECGCVHDCVCAHECVCVYVWWCWACVREHDCVCTRAWVHVCASAQSVMHARTTIHTPTRTHTHTHHTHMPRTATPHTTVRIQCVVCAVRMLHALCMPTHRVRSARRALCVRRPWCGRSGVAREAPTSCARVCTRPARIVCHSFHSHHIPHAPCAWCTTLAHRPHSVCDVCDARTACAVCIRHTTISVHDEPLHFKTKARHASRPPTAC